MPLSDYAPATALQLPASRGRKTEPNSLSVAQAAIDAASWDGSSFDARGYGSVSIWCSAAPSSARTIQSGPDGSVWLDQAGVINTGSDIATGKTISAACRAILPGGCFVRLNGGSGGTFLISAQ